MQKNKISVLNYGDTMMAAPQSSKMLVVKESSFVMDTLHNIVLGK